MTASEAIARAKETRQGAIDYSQYLKWINVIEGRIQVEVMGKGKDDLISYTEGTDNRELLIPHPYDEVYIYYLCAMTDFYNEELETYAIDAAVFEQKFDEFKRFYIKTAESSDIRIHGWWNS